METYKKIGTLQVSSILANFINSEALPNTEVSEKIFWETFETIIKELLPKNQSLLHKRTQLQKSIGEWHKQNKDNFDKNKYITFLEKIGYLQPIPTDVKITTSNVDNEIAKIAGPQLVVPVNNARYALNAVNARWGSLYDAVYGSNIIPEENGKQKGSSYNVVRGEAVVTFVKDFLDEVFPLKNGSHNNVVMYYIKGNILTVTLENSEETTLKDINQFVAYNGDKETPSTILLLNNDLHVELIIDKNHPVGKNDKAFIKDIVLESAITAIMDCEDSVAAVDAEDKVTVYRNWLGLMKGDLVASFKKGDKTITRELDNTKTYTHVNGSKYEVNGRALMLVRNVGHLMTNPAILTEEGIEVPEGIIDAMVTSLIAKHDLLKAGTRNSREGSVYIVKPKMHGSEEVAFTNELFNKVEDALGLRRNTLKIGIMDEERRTSLNLLACIQEARERIVFINTGFLDRTGDEMHTSMEAGTMIRKAEMKTSTWLNAYEKSNVASGLLTGFKGKAQIGKGMWAMPDQMKEMIEQKGSQLQAGANTAWVPSPTAASLHAMHYHKYYVPNIQDSIVNNSIKDYRNQILEIPLDKNKDWSKEEIQKELDNNAQGILGYVVRWIDQGIGCSKVPDINNVALMEDRATLRISSQHMANWLHHGIVTEEQILQTMEKMAKVVDEQNSNDTNYHPMSTNFVESIAYQASLELVLKGHEQPNGYTEPILHKSRLKFKAKSNS